MAKLVELIPNMSDRELLTLFRNASNLVAEGKNVQNAESAIFAIERQWKKQLDNTADNDHTIPATGMLATLGYHVGSAQGKKHAFVGGYSNTFSNGSCLWLARANTQKNGDFQTHQSGIES
jgi:hypothetical protein